MVPTLPEDGNWHPETRRCHFEVGRILEQAARCLRWTAENAPGDLRMADSIRALKLALELAQSCRPAHELNCFSLFFVK